MSRIRLDPLTNTLVLRGGHLRAALAVYGVGLFPGDVQVLDAVIARGLDAEDAVLEPRLGYFQLDAAKLSLDFSKNAIDPRFDPKILCAVKKRGLTLERAMPGLPPGFVDTGFPTLVTRVDGNLHGMTPARLNGLAAGD